ncbi:MAG TPA: hypothetical protein VGK04_11250 [Thermoanaerobaculia bacterium]
MRSGTFSRAALLIVLAIGVRPAVAFTVAPAHLYLDVAAGAHEERTIALHDVNPPVMVSLGPFVIDPDGQPRRGGDNERSGVRWIVAVSDDEGMIRVVIDPPAGARGSYWSAVAISSRSDQITTRIVVPVVVTILGTESRAITVQTMSAEAGEGEVMISAIARNDGNTAVRVPLLITLESDQVEVASADIDEILLLPGMTRRIKVHIQHETCKKERLTAILAIRYADTASCIVWSMKSVTNS